MRLHHLLALLSTTLQAERMHRVDGVNELRRVLAHVLVSQHTLVHTVQIGVELYKQLLLRKRLAPIRDTLSGTGSFLLFAVDVLERLAGVRIQHQVLLIRREYYLPRVCHHHCCIAKALAVVVDHHVVEHGATRVFVADVNLVPAYTIIELTLRYVQFGRFLPQ